MSIGGRRRRCGGALRAGSTVCARHVGAFGSWAAPQAPQSSDMSSASAHSRNTWSGDLSAGGSVLLIAGTDGPLLAAVLTTEVRVPVGTLRGRIEQMERQLPDLHPGPEA